MTSSTFQCTRSKAGWYSYLTSQGSALCSAQWRVHFMDPSHSFGLLALAVFGGLLLSGAQIPNLTLSTAHPEGLPVWPLLMVTISCGAISGFHSTQSPIIARTVRKESEGRKVFFGAMIAEGIIALIWATAGMTFLPITTGDTALRSSRMILTEAEQFLQTICSQTDIHRNTAGHSLPSFPTRTLKSRRAARPSTMASPYSKD